MDPWVNQLHLTKQSDKQRR